MTDSELINLAKSAGFNRQDHSAILAMLLDFGQMIAEAERKACVKLAEDVGMKYYYSEGTDAAYEVSKQIKKRNNLL